MSTRIREEIVAHTLPTLDIYNINCEALWEILQYCELELSGSHNLCKSLTLTGTTIQAQVVSCEDYVRMVWKSTGLKLLEAVIRGLSKSKCGKFSLCVPRNRSGCFRGGPLGDHSTRNTISIQRHRYKNSRES